MVVPFRYSLLKVITPEWWKESECNGPRFSIEASTGNRIENFVYVTRYIFEYLMK